MREQVTDIEFSHHDYSGSGFEMMVVYSRLEKITDYNMTEGCLVLKFLDGSFLVTPLSQIIGSILISEPYWIDMDTGKRVE